MDGVVLFGTGSPLLPDVEESLHRAGVRVAAGIRNRPGVSYLADDTPSFTPGEEPPELARLPWLVPLFTPAWRQLAAREAAVLGFTQPFVLVDPTVIAPRHWEIGAGSYVNAGCVSGAASTLGVFVLINRAASIGHHARLGDFVSVGPGVVIAGDVTIGTGAVVGAGATVLPGVTIGANAVVGAGAVVTRDVPAACVAVGNPARIVRRDSGGYRGLAVA